MSIVQTVAPAQLPVSLSEAKTQCRVKANDEDDKIRSLILAAAEYAQQYQWTQLISATFVERFDGFPSVIKPSRSPVSSVTSVAYVDSAGATQTLTVDVDYTVDLYSMPARIIPAYGAAWPSTKGHVNDVVVTYVAGYGAAAANVPENVRHAILLLVADWYLNHEASTEAMSRSIAFSVKALLDLNSFRTFY